MTPEDKVLFDRVKETIGPLYKAAFELSEGLTVEAFRASVGQETELLTATAIYQLQLEIRDVDMFLARAMVRAEAASWMTRQARRRYYLVRRPAGEAAAPFHWKELEAADGPWGNLEQAAKIRTIRNGVEQQERRPQVRGWVPGAHVWVIWTYDPETDTWDRIPEDAAP